MDAVPAAGFRTVKLNGHLSHRPTSLLPLAWGPEYDPHEDQLRPFSNQAGLIAARNLQSRHRLPKTREPAHNSPLGHRLFADCSQKGRSEWRQPLHISLSDRPTSGAAG